MPRLSTHVLDTVKGGPAAGMRIDLHRLDLDGPPRHLKTVVTNADGRTDEPLLAGEAIAAGTYRLTFHVGEYFAAAGSPDACRVLREVPRDRRALGETQRVNAGSLGRAEFAGHFRHRA